MAKEKDRQRPMVCPVGRFFMDLEKAMAKKRPVFLEHFGRSRIEFLKAIRSLLDEGIADLEKTKREKPGKRAKKIRLE